MVLFSLKVDTGSNFCARHRVLLKLEVTTQWIDATSLSGLCFVVRHLYSHMHLEICPLHYLINQGLLTLACLLLEDYDLDDFQRV